MEFPHRLRFAGWSCMAGAALWFVALLIEYRYGLFPPSSGALFVINQAMFGVAMVGYLAGIGGLLWGRAAGGRLGVIALSLFLMGWCAIFVSHVISLLSGSSVLDLLAPIGGILGNVAALLAGIAIAVAGRWRGWPRFAVLVYGLYYLLVLFLPIVIADQEPTLVTEAGWALMWLLVGAAVSTSGDAAQAARTALVTEGGCQ